jgi:hypothetical protein
MRWRSPAGYTVEVVRLSMTRRGRGGPTGPAGDGEQFLVRLPGGRVAEYTRSMARVRELIPDFDLLRETSRGYLLRATAAGVW